MLTKESIEEVIRKRNNNNRNLTRDIQIIQSYFGLGIQTVYTHESLGKEFGGITRERVRQIIDEKFVQRMQKADKEILYEIESVIREFPKIWFGELKRVLHTRGLADYRLHNYGLNNLIQAFQICPEYGVYTRDFNVATRYDFIDNAPVFMVQKNLEPSLLEEFNTILNVLGMHGIVCLEMVFKQENLDKRNFSFFRSLLTHSEECWTHESQEGLWYLWEGRDGVLLNVLQKMSFVTKEIPIDVISDIVHRYINRRTLPYGTPSQKTITTYLKESANTIYENDQIILLLDGKELNNIEKNILQFYRDRREINIGYSELSIYLKELGYQKPNYDKALFQSPIIYVERSDGRGNYRFIIIDALETKNLYEKTKNRLEKLEGTNISAEVQLRKEQHILREWLFLGKKSEYCALCGNLYSILSMVCAHKKKRAYCTGDERVDPYIVMPLCLFGCDVMYENEYFEIVEGRVFVHVEELTEVEKIYVTRSLDRKIDTKWLKGNSDYFKRNYEVEQ